jgi:glycosyltransferase involved in cell wall biosynthesis
VAGPAIVVDPHDASAWAEQIARLHDDAAARAAIAERGVAHARTFSWDRVAARLIELYRYCLEGGR